MDFHSAFYEIDTDHSGEITRDELIDYMRRKSYKETFVQKWLSLFDVDNSGTITYEEYCNTLGLVPREPEVKPIVEETVAAAKAGRVSSALAKTPPKEEVMTQKATTKLKAAPKAPEAKTTPARKDGKGSCRSGDMRNSVLSTRNGVLMRFSGARVIQKKAMYRIKPCTVRGGGVGKKAATTSNKAPTTITKEVNGDNNGQTRTVPVNRSPRSYPVEQIQFPGRKGRRREGAARPVARLRSSIQPGSVLIMLTGRHRGKRVVFLKQMDRSGLLLVTGPMKLNGCPLRRVNQKHVIATSTRVDITEVSLPERLTDAYFQRARGQTRNRGGADGDIFKKESVRYELTAERREDQTAVDSGVLAAIKSREDCTLLRGYLRQMFALKRGDLPHNMQF